MKLDADIAPLSRWRPPTLGPTFNRRGTGARRRKWLFTVALGGAMLLIGLTATIAGTQTRREVSGLPGAERSEIYARLVDDLERSCAAPTAGEVALRDHCRQQAAFVVLFPECDARCTSLAKSILPRARR